MVLVLFLMTLTGCGASAYQRARVGIIGSQAAITAASPLVDELEAQETLSAEQAADLREKGALALTTLGTALETAEATESAETLLGAVLVVVNGVDQVLATLPDTEELARFRLAVLGVRTALLVAQGFAVPEG